MFSQQDFQDPFGLGEDLQGLFAPQSPQLPMTGGPQGGMHVGVPTPPAPPVYAPEPPTGTRGPEGTGTGPRESHPGEEPGTLYPTPPEPRVSRVPIPGITPTPDYGTPQVYGATPSQAQEPTPVASLAPRPFAPMAPPMMPIGESPLAGRLLFGRAGGLLGGGIGVPGALSGGGSQDDVSALMQLMKYLGGDSSRGA